VSVLAKGAGRDLVYRKYMGVCVYIGGGI